MKKLLLSITALFLSFSLLMVSAWAWLSSGRFLQNLKMTTGHMEIEVRLYQFYDFNQDGILDVFTEDIDGTIIHKPKYKEIMGEGDGPLVEIEKFAPGEVYTYLVVVTNNNPNTETLFNVGVRNDTDTSEGEVDIAPALRLRAAELPWWIQPDASDVREHEQRILDELKAKPVKNEPEISLFDSDSVVLSTASTTMTPALTNSEINISFTKFYILAISFEDAASLDIDINSYQNVTFSFTILAELIQNLHESEIPVEPDPEP